MRHRALRLATTAIVALAVVGCTQAPPGAATSTADSSGAPKALPPGVTKTKKGYKGKMTFDTRAKLGGAPGIED